MLNQAPFSKSGLQVLAGEYLAGSLLKWDEMSLFDHLFAAGFEPEIRVLTWELSPLLCNMVMVVGPGSPEAVLLRVVLAPEFVWFGLHWAGLPSPVPVSTCDFDLPDLLHSRPLAASMAIHQNLGVGDQWKSLVRRLWVHFEPYSSPLVTNDDVLPMEGIEFVSGVIIDTVMRDLSPDTDVRVVLGAPAPSAMTSSPVPEASSGRAAAPSPSPGYETPAKGKYRQRY